MGNKNFKEWEKQMAQVLCEWESKRSGPEASFEIADRFGYQVHNLPEGSGSIIVQAQIPEDYPQDGIRRVFDLKSDSYTFCLVPPKAPDLSKFSEAEIAHRGSPVREALFSQLVSQTIKATSIPFMHKYWKGYKHVCGIDPCKYGGVLADSITFYFRPKDIMVSISENLPPYTFFDFKEHKMKFDYSRLVTRDIELIENPSK